MTSAPEETIQATSIRSRPSGDSLPGKAALVASMIALPAVYLLFVVHYSTNVLFLDDWSVVPLVHGAMHGGLTLSALWAQHNENRMFVPNLVQVGLGVVTHENVVVVVVGSALLFIATYAVFLAAFQTYAGRPLTPLVVLLLGAVWFSIVDWENALWAFQFAWYLILFCLIAMIYGLQRGWFVAALLLAILASFSSLQGLFLWPVGLMWLVLRKRRCDKEVLWWTGVAVLTTVLYFVSFQRGTVVPIWRYPVLTAKFVLIELGEVVPQQAYNWTLHELFGSLILAAAAFVVVQSIRHDRDGLLVVFIAFGLIFDLFIALGREEFGFVEAAHSDYSMPNVLIIVAIVAYACAHFNRSWMFAILTALVAVQLVAATDSGLNAAMIQDRFATDNARILVNLDRIPVRERGCYAIYAVYDVDGYADLQLAKKDRLSEFSQGPLERYGAEGVAAIPQCP
jgi:hypothetical protein